MVNSAPTSALATLYGTNPSQTILYDFWRDSQDNYWLYVVFIQTNKDPVLYFQSCNLFTLNNIFTKQTLTGLCVDNVIVTETAVVFSCMSKSRVTIYRRSNSLSALS